MMHYAKGVAYAALGEVTEAEAEQARFRDTAKRVPESRYIHNVPCVQLLAIAEEMLEGEIAYRHGEHDAAFARLRAAIALEDDLPSTNLGAGCSRSAMRSVRCCWSRGERRRRRWCIARIWVSAACCRAQIYPDNLWALRGLLDCLERCGETAEAAIIRQRVKFAAARADLPVEVSCFCARG
jgi:hypothetical protein